MRSGLQRTLVIYALFLIALSGVLFSVHQAHEVVEPYRVMRTSVSEEKETETEITEIVNINTADAEVLQTLPGIGKVLAERILEYRETNGAFYDVSELCEVEGIGEKMLISLLPYICT